MTYQTCCGGIQSNNLDITEGETPYMIRKCLSSNDWNKAECNKNCCKNGGECIPTEQGGYCKDNDIYYDYGRDGGQNMKDADDAHRQYPYRHDPEFPYGRYERRYNRHEFDNRRWDRSYAQAQRNIVNRFLRNKVKYEDSDFNESSMKVFTPEKYSPITKVIMLISFLFIITILLSFLAYAFKFKYKTKYRNLLRKFL